MIKNDLLNLVRIYEYQIRKYKINKRVFDKNFDLFIARMSDVELQSFEYKKRINEPFYSKITFIGDMFWNSISIRFRIIRVFLLKLPFKFESLNINYCLIIILLLIAIINTLYILNISMKNYDHLKNYREKKRRR